MMALEAGMLDGAMPNEPEDILHGLGNTVSYTTSNRPTFRKLKRKLEILALLKFPIFAYLRQGGDVLADQLLTTERLLSELRIKIPDEACDPCGLCVKRRSQRNHIVCASL